MRFLVGALPKVQNLIRKLFFSLSSILLPINDELLFLNHLFFLVMSYVCIAYNLQLSRVWGPVHHKSKVQLSPNMELLGRLKITNLWYSCLFRYKVLWPSCPNMAWKEFINYKGGMHTSRERQFICMWSMLDGCGGRDYIMGRFFPFSTYSKSLAVY